LHYGKENILTSPVKSFAPFYESILLPVLFLVLACQSTIKKTPKAKAPEKTFNYSAFGKDYKDTWIA